MKQPLTGAERAIPVQMDQIWPGEDQIWPGGNRDVERWAATDEARMVRCERVLHQVSADIAHGHGKCSACRAAIATTAELGEVSIAHLEPVGQRLAIGIPFCVRCATSPERVAVLAERAIARLLDLKSPPVLTDRGEFGSVLTGGT